MKYKANHKVHISILHMFRANVHTVHTVQLNTNLFHALFYLLFRAPTCFGCSCWPSSGTLYIFVHVQLVGEFINNKKKLYATSLC